MEAHNFKIIGGDTDSIMFCKPDESPFTKEEQRSLIDEINALLPKMIKYDSDGIFKRVVYLKAKNYLMVDEKGKWKIKGSALKSSTLEPALKDMLKEMLDAIVYDKGNDELVNIYHKYVKIVRDGITDIKPWSKKMQLSPTTFNSTRTNETKIVDALKGTEYKSGDRVYLYTTPDHTLKLVEQYDGQYDKITYLDKLFKTTKRFETILPVKEMFLNYSLKRNSSKINDI